MKFRFLLTSLVLCSLLAQSQTNNMDYRTSRFYLAWGWNLDWFSNSDLHFVGEGYDFTLKDVKAVDKRIGFQPKTQLNPMKATIPQTNFRLGYFLNERYSLVFGFDHMKYLMVSGQEVIISGKISDSGTEYDGVYDNDPLVISKSFLEYENSDGLNFIFLELNRHLPLYTLLNKDNEVRHGLELIAGLGAGVLVPRTDAHLLMHARNNNYHLTGVGTGLKISTRVTIFKHFFIQSELKGGYINMPRVKATSDDRAYLSQSFLYGQANLMFGATMNILGK